MGDIQISAIHAQMGEIAKEIGAIGRDSENSFHGYKFRSIDQVYNVLGPLMAKHGVYCTINVRDVKVSPGGKDGKSNHVLLWVDYWFVSAVDGSKVFCEMLGEGMDSGDKAVNKAYAAAHKYCLLQAFCIPTAEQRDGDFESPGVKPSAPKQAPKQPPKQDKPKPPARPLPVSVKDTDDVVQGLIDDLAITTTAKGSTKWTAYIQGSYYGAFDEAWGVELARAYANGAEVGVTYKLSGRWRNVTSVCVLEDLPPKNKLDDPNYSDEEPPPIDDPVQPTLSDVPF